MKVLHVCLANFYIDNYSYQENMLTRYHKSLGLDVEIIASLVSFNSNGELCELEKGGSYYNEHRIKVTRLEYKANLLSRRFRIYEGTYEEIIKSKPDIIFIHGCQFADIKYFVKYAKENPKVRIYVDNHADFNNSGRNFLSRNILHKIIWRKCALDIEPYTRKFYGVLPARVNFLIDVYKVPREKTELLVMGVDDEKVEEMLRTGNEANLKKELNINDEDFVIVTGGKIDTNKSQTLNLMEAVNKIDTSKIKLIIFGSVIPEFKEKFNSLLTDKIRYIGWVNSSDIYKYFNLANLVFFPGLHSVLWEQAVGLGKPCVFKYIEGFTHVDLGGNCIFLQEDSTTEIIEILNTLIFDEFSYKKISLNARKQGRDKFSYKKISARSIELERGAE